MNIGLLVSELEDSEVKKICMGASLAAKEKGVSLVIMPGKYLAGEALSYQHTALFDYANSSEFDALIIDIERIGRDAPILKKEAFLKKYSDIPVLTLTETEGFTAVNTPENGEPEQLGFEAVCDAVFFAKNQVLPPSEDIREFDEEDKTETRALEILSTIGYTLLNRKYDSEKAYSAFTDVLLKENINNSGILLFEKKVRNTAKYPWTKPENISIKGAVIGGDELSFQGSGMQISTDNIFSTFSKDGPDVFVAGDLFVGEYQIGLIVTEFSPMLLIDHFFDNLMSIITGVSRLSYLEQALEKTTGELYEVQEELARDDSVLDHIGDQDYLTGGLNRRGFFAKAYDLLKEEFKDGTYAVVAYIHLESLKKINEMFGHDEGDRAVKRVAEILDEVFGESICGRIRGDEFAVIEITDEEGKAEALRQEMSTQNARLLSKYSRYVNNLQYSICEFGHDENLSLREMLKETDENLQRIKGNR